MTQHDMTEIAKTLADAQSELAELSEKMKHDQAARAWQAVAHEAERRGRFRKPLRIGECPRCGADLRPCLSGGEMCGNCDWIERP